MQKRSSGVWECRKTEPTNAVAFLFFLLLAEAFMVFGARAFES